MDALQAATVLCTAASIACSCVAIHYARDAARTWRELAALRRR